MKEIVYDLEEYEKWVAKQYATNTNKVYSPKLNRKHPREEKLRDFRLSKSPLNTRYSFTKESYTNKRYWQSRIRMKLERKMYDEVYYNIRPRDYRTYGWLTW